MGKADYHRRQLPIPNLIGASFGGLWAAAGSMALPRALRDVLLVAAAVITAGVVLRLLRNRRVTPSQNSMFQRGPYAIAVAFEAVAIAAVVALLPRYGAERYILQAIGIIVGLHFIGLWKASRSRKVLWIAAGMCLISALAVAAPQPVTAGVATGDALTGFGNAFILWIGASLPG